mgnify:CR=1 FL=1
MPKNFEQPDDANADAFTWEHWTKPRVQPVDLECGYEVDEVHQYDKPIGGTGSPAHAPKG